MQGGLIRSCHDLSEGGLATALAEMAFAGDLGADLTELRGDTLPDEAMLFSETTTRFVIEVKPDNATAVQELFADLPLTPLGRTVKEPRLRITAASGEWVVWANLAELKEAWQKPLRW
jgi:phosphoribosylformylglycinamidine synthase